MNLLQKLSAAAFRRRRFGSSCTERKIRVGEDDINYVSVGEGPAKVLLMPGALGSAWTDFRPQIEGLRRDLFTLVAWDPPGYGKSVPPKREYPVDFFERDADKAFLLMKALKAERFSVLGWSDGGITSLILAAKRPENVTKAVVWGANAQILKSDLVVYEGLRDTSKWSRRAVEPMVELYGEKYFAETWNKWCDAMNAIYKNNRGNICVHLLPDIKCPVFIVHGEKDPMIHPQHVPVLKSNIPKAELHVYPEGKHNVHLKYAEDFNKRVTAFLAPHANQRGS